jgi:hypothetical protein
MSPYIFSPQHASIRWIRNNIHKNGINSNFVLQECSLIQFYRSKHETLKIKLTAYRKFFDLQPYQGDRKN